MNKKLCVLYSAVDTYSGYGSSGRNLAKVLIELKGEEWDIKIVSCNWGNTPKNFLDENPEWSYLKKYIIPLPLQIQPDVWIQHTIPGEFSPIGKYNIGYTPGIESTISPPDWVEGCQRMDLVLGSSKHTIDILKNSKFEKRDQNTQQPIGNIEWNKKGDILFEGMDTELYFPIEWVD